MNIAYTDSMDAFVAWANSDLTEGRGSQLPIAVCKSETTAKRLGKKRNVQGCDADVEPAKLYRIDGVWYGPVHVNYPNREDEATDAKRSARNAAIERARRAGLSEEDIKTIHQQINEP